MRVYEIAKEIGIPNKDLIAKIRALGLEVNNHMSEKLAKIVKEDEERARAAGREPVPSPSTPPTPPKKDVE